MKKVLPVCFIVLLALGGVAVAQDDGGKLFKTNCAGCHGEDGGTLKGQTSDALMTKLKGYAAGTYGGEKKAVMEKVVKKHSEETLKKITDYLGGL